MAIDVAVDFESDDIPTKSFQCEILESSLLLTHWSDKNIEVPCGSEATYIGGNIVRVFLGDHQFKITILKSDFNRDDFARDLAAFVNGSGHAPVVGADDYSLPSILYAIGVLPWGILILVVGAVPAVLCLGLSAACFSIARRQHWSVARRAMLALVLVLVGYVIAIALGLFMLRLRQFQ